RRFRWSSRPRPTAQACARQRGIVSITLRNCPKLNRLAAAYVAGQSRVTRDGDVATIVECATRAWPLREMAGVAYGCPVARGGAGGCGDCGGGERSGRRALPPIRQRDGLTSPFGYLRRGREGPWRAPTPQPTEFAGVQ